MTPDRPSIEELLDGIFTVIDAYREIGIAYRMGGRRTPNKALDTVRSFDPAAAREALRSRFLEQQKELEDNRALRREWWLSHGCPMTALYGDDGEMSCGECGIDFKRWPPNSISARLANTKRTRPTWAAIQPEGTPQK